MKRLSTEDLEYINSHTKGLCESLRNKSIFITGGTGFIGKWLIETLLYFNDVAKARINITLLTRNIDSFKIRYPHIANSKYLLFIEGDIRTFNYPDISYDYVIHAATDASAKLNVENPLAMSDVIIDGTKHLLGLAVKCKAKKVLFLSSGAVYGKQPEGMIGFKEDYQGSPDQLSVGSAYAESKRMAEFLCATYARQYNINISIARCFAFVGPYLPLDTHFAIGNFINDGLHGRNITVTGNGLPLRSYMYASDMVVWLFTILLKGKNGEAYNVGSDNAISIKDLAYMVASFFPETKVNILNQTRLTDRNQNYIPCIDKIRCDLALLEILSLKESIRRTVKFYL